MERCDERLIPTVDHATYAIQYFGQPRYSGHTIPENFTLPGYVNVTYTCDEGYCLQDAYKRAIGCEYNVTKRRQNNGVTANALWTSTDDIVCRKCKQLNHVSIHLKGV